MMMVRIRRTVIVVNIFFYSKAMDRRLSIMMYMMILMMTIISTERRFCFRCHMMILMMTLMSTASDVTSEPIHQPIKSLGGIM